MKRTHFFLLIIFILGTFLRFYRLGEIPAGFHRDEAFLGYNGYSIQKTGKDISGNAYPMHLESFLYSPSGYSYLTIPSIALFGLCPFSIRFPGALFGSLTILIAFFLARRLFDSNENTLIGLCSALFVAITPWHINLSRTSAESIPVAFFIALGVFLFFKSKELKSVFPLFTSFVSFAVTLTLYQAPRAFLPLFVPVVAVFTSYWKNQKKMFLMAVLYGFVIILPVFFILINPNLNTRIRSLSIFHTPGTQLVLNEQIREDGMARAPILLTRIYHNKLVGYTYTFIDNFASHLSHSFLFTDKGLPDRYRVPGIGLLYLSYIPLLLYGIYSLAKEKPETGIFIAIWAFLTIVGSALTYDDVPNLQRTVLIFPVLPFITAYGTVAFLKNKTLKPFLGVVFLLLFFESTRYFFHYNIQLLQHRPWFRNEGYEAMVNGVNSRINSYKSVVITNSQTAPNIFLLFFGKYDPAIYLKETTTQKNPDIDRISFSKYQISGEECPFLETDSLDVTTGAKKTICYANPDTLYVNTGTCAKPIYCGKVLQSVKRGDGTEIFTILEFTNPPATVSVQPKSFIR